MMIPDITEEDEGAYRCTAKNENSSKFKDTEIRLECELKDFFMYHLIQMHF